MRRKPTAFSTRRPSLLAAIALLAIALLGGPGCDSRSEDSGESGASSTGGDKTGSSDALPERTETINGVEIVYESGPEPDADTVLAAAGEIEVTLEDFERAMKRSLLIAPSKNGDAPTEVPADRLAVPQTQLSVVRRLLAAEIIEHAAQKRGIEVSAAEKKEALESHPRLSEYADLIGAEDKQLPEKLEKIGLSVDDVEAIARDVVLRQKLRDDLITQIDEDELWEAYKTRKNTVELVLAWVRNTPRSSTIDAFVREQEDAEESAIEAYFEANKRQYRRPKMLEAVTLSPKPGEDADKATLEEAAQRLKDEADYANIAEELGLKLEEKAHLVRQENSKAFGSDVGTTGFEMSGPRGAYAWRVTGFTESKPAELDSGLRRQIAAEILRERSVVPTAAAKLTKMRRAMAAAETTEDGSLTDDAVESLRKKADELGLKFEVTEAFPLTGRGFIPGIGLAREVVDVANKLTMDDPLASRPVLSRGKAYMVRLHDKNVPTREQFEEDLEDFRKRYIAEQRRRILDQFVASWENEHDVQLDVRPLRVKYGVAQKK